MKKLGILALALVLMSGAGPTPLEAQSRMGGFLDWVHKLSGPRMVGVNVSWIEGPTEAPVSLRAAGSARWAVEGPDDLTMYSLQGQVDYYWRFLRGRRIEVASGAGVAYHRFTSEAASFWHYSYPLYPVELDWHAVQGSRWAVDVILNAGVHAFPPFSEGDVGDLDLGMSTNDWEFPFAFTLGVAIDFHRLLHP